MVILPPRLSHLIVVMSPIPCFVAGLASRSYGRCGDRRPESVGQPSLCRWRRRVASSEMGARDQARGS